MYGHGVLGLEQTYDDSAGTLRQAAADGARIWRTTADLRSGSVSDDVTAAVHGAQANKMDVLVTATYSATGVYHQVPVLPAQRQAWADNVGKIVARNRGLIRAVEVWNEGNHGPMNMAPNPSSYFDLLRRAYQAIKAADANVLVLSTGTSPAPTNPPNDWAPVDWVTELYKIGRVPCDAFAHHPYTYPDAASTVATWSAAQQTYRMQQVIAWCEAVHGHPTKPIWATEVCFPSHADAVRAPTRQYVDEQTQLHRMADLVGVWRSWWWTGPLVWFGDRDSAENPPSDPALWGALRRSDGSEKPLLPWFRQLSKDGVRA